MPTNPINQPPNFNPNVPNPNSPANTKPTPQAPTTPAPPPTNSPTAVNFPKAPTTPNPNNTNNPNLKLPGPTNPNTNPNTAPPTSVPPRNPAPPAQPVGGQGEHYVTASAGDSVPSLAYKHGHFWEFIWNHGNNSQLKTARKSPNILFPGDRVYIPPVRQKFESRGMDASHKFSRKGTPNKLRMQLLLFDEPRANEEYTLKLGKEVIRGTTDSNGVLEHFIPPDCAGGELLLAAGKERYPVRIGHLNPIESISGVRQRLNNLGFFAGDSSSEEEDDRLIQALHSFQGANNLPQSGEINDATRNALRSLHGS